MNRDEAYNQSLVTAFENQKQIHNQNYLDAIESNIKQAAKNGLTSTSVTFSILPGEGVAEMQIAQLEHCIKVLKEKGFECSPVHTTAYTYNSPRLLMGSVLARCMTNLDEVTVDTVKLSESLSVQRVYLKDKVNMYYNDPVDILQDSTTNLPVEIQCYLKVGDVVVVDKGLVRNENTSIFLTLLQLVYLTVLALYEQYESDIIFESLADKVARALEQ